MRNQRAWLRRMASWAGAPQTMNVPAPQRPRTAPALAVMLDQRPQDVPELSVLAVRVSETGMLQVEGFFRTHESKVPLNAAVVSAWLRRGSERLKGDVTPAPRSPIPNLVSKDSRSDLSGSGFVVTFDDFDRSASATYTLDVCLELDDVCVVSRFSHRYERGSAQTLGARAIGQGVFLIPSWDRQLGIQVAVATGKSALEAGGIRTRDGECTLRFRAPQDFTPRRAQWSRGLRSPALRLIADGEDDRVFTVAFDTHAMATGEALRVPVDIELIGAGGSTRLLHQGPGPTPTESLIPGTRVEIASDHRGVLQFRRAENRCAVESIEIVDEGRELVARGRYFGEAPLAMTLTGARIDNRGAVRVLSGSEFECRFSLYAVAWLGDDRPLPSGNYWIEVEHRGAPPSMATVSRVIEQDLPRIDRVELAHYRLERGSMGQLAIHICPPLDDGEVGVPGRKAVTAIKHRTPIAADALYLESWFGKSFSDNLSPLADALRGDFKDIIVGVVDHSVEVPHDVSPVIVGSRAWWDAVTGSRVMVNNSWIPGTFRRRKGQKVIQTWHGTPLKKLGLDRALHEGRDSTAKTFAWGSSKWDLLVSPNAYSTEIFRRAYAYDGEIAEIGYPRNDILVTGDDVRTKVRAGLGIAESETVVLYAPTFRESQRGRSTFCDVEALARKLGSGFRLLVRGHSATLRTGADHRASNVLDVTSYPDSSHMLAIADVLVTDYSSVMFDFTATRRPIVFFTPDIDEYINDGRGVYFDLDAQAPGPVVRSERSLPGAIRRAWKDRAVESAKYDAWFEKFNSNDDGGATERLAAIVREW